MPTVLDMARHVVATNPMSMVVLAMALVGSKVMCAAIIATGNVMTTEKPVIVMEVSRWFVIPVMVMGARGRKQADQEA